MPIYFTYVVLASARAQDVLWDVPAHKAGDGASPAFVPRGDPCNQTIFWLAIFLPIWYSKLSRPAAAQGKRSFRRTVGMAFGIYYVAFVLLYCCMMATICKAKSYMPGGKLMRLPRTR
jgi:hypothetical protein